MVSGITLLQKTKSFVHGASLAICGEDITMHRFSFSFSLFIHSFFCVVAEAEAEAELASFNSPSLGFYLR
ncbi:hypothetical protein RIF29_41828 [Crotalaria pallida]|uniref:Uncharacterized protein n=1 Tax=Crotalaria pallida TaxID=3830 RepID=A0AAN9EBC3_CROPI